jgi:hypothetical protein
MGAVMFFVYGGGGIRFGTRHFENAPKDNKAPKELVLDGQQRLTASYSAMLSRAPVTVKGEISRYYYADIEKCVDKDTDRDEAIVSVPADKKVKDPVNRSIILDLSTRENEYMAGMFPLNIVYDSIALMNWQSEYIGYHNGNPEKRKTFDAFVQDVLKKMLNYSIPIISLGDDTTSEAVCKVFENVNQGGVKLTVFELLTAKFAGEDKESSFRLREYWDDCSERMSDYKGEKGTFGLLSVVDNADFLSAVTLFSQIKHNSTSERKKRVSARRTDVLDLRYAEFDKYKAPIESGFVGAAEFLVNQCSILRPGDIPYLPQLVPLSVIMAILGEKADTQPARENLSIWYWCGVFGEMYGSAIETRYAADVREVPEWINGGNEPDTVSRATFAPERLLSLQTRGSAAYKGILALILKQGALDFIKSEKMDFRNVVSDGVDIHHIFPKLDCIAEKRDIRKWNSAVNKTPLTKKTNTFIGGDAPSKYLSRIEKDKGLTSEQLNKNIASHGIDVDLLRNGNFDEFILSRAKYLLTLIYAAMGKSAPNLNDESLAEIFGVAK